MKYPKYKYFYAIIDFLIVLFSLFEAKKLVFLYNQEYFKSSIDSNIYLIILFIIIAIIFLWNFQVNNLYKLNVFLNKSHHVTAIIRSLSYSIIFVILLSFIIKFPAIRDSRLFVILFTAIIFINLLIIRVILLRIFYLRFKHYNIFSRKVLIWGAGKAGSLLAAKLLFENDYGIKIIGFIDDFKPIGSEIIKGLKVLGGERELVYFKNQFAVDEIIIAIDKIDYPNLLDKLDRCGKFDLNIKISSELFNIIPKKIITETYGGIPVIDVAQRFDKNFNLLIKRIIDIIGSLFGLIILSPLFIILALIIKATSKGPVFYSHSRIGKNGKSFLFYKFRSMTICKDDDKERQNLMLDFMKNGNRQNSGDTKIINNSRLTMIGKFIRKTSLDELPQLINVLKGDMSLVGPRPCLPYEYQNYDEWQKRRTSVIPGCTGVWQVSGRSNVSFNDSIVLDIYYINNMSPWLDIQLIIKTIPVMLFGKGGK